MMVVDFSSATQWPGRMCFAQTRKHPSDTASCFTYRPLYWDDRKVSQQMPLREVTSIRLSEAPGDLMLHSLGVMNDDCCRMFVHYLERADGVKTSETSRFSNFGVRSPMPDLILPRARLRIELTRRVPVALPWTTDHHAKTMTIELLEDAQTQYWDTTLLLQTHHLRYNHGQAFTLPTYLPYSSIDTALHLSRCSIQTHHLPCLAGLAQTGPPSPCRVCDKHGGEEQRQKTITDMTLYSREQFLGQR